MFLPGSLTGSDSLAVSEFIDRWDVCGSFVKAVVYVLCIRVACKKLYALSAAVDIIVWPCG